MIKDMELKYSVGALLYSPALNTKISKTVISGRLGRQYSLALCLEDTISEDVVEIAERNVVNTIKQIFEASKQMNIYIPKIFIRVREPEQTIRIFKEIQAYQDIITGFIFPKYSVANAELYNIALRQVNSIAYKKIYMMPVLESRDIINYQTRSSVLESIKQSIDSVKEYILNVRVGGNDFSNEFSVRRHYDETIYEILPINHILGDILTIFSREYVVSGAVWEFFSSENDEWKKGLQRELKLDRLNGFIGKTVIHPKQIPVVNEMLKVTSKDYEDAKAILNWGESGLQVGNSHGRERMNEVRTNNNWARKILILAEQYGVI